MLWFKRLVLEREHAFWNGNMQISLYKLNELFVEFVESSFACPSEKHALILWLH
jgi:hypothetical protein